MTRKIIKRSNSSNKVNEIMREKEGHPFAAASQKAKEQAAQRQQVQVNSSDHTSAPSRRTIHLPVASQPSESLAVGSKRERFEDTHNRVTTYINKSNHEKLKRLRENHSVPISETINRAIAEYFSQHKL